MMFYSLQGGQLRQLKHYMFSGWSDHEGLTYASSILSMLEMVKSDPGQEVKRPTSNGHAPLIEEEGLYDNQVIINRNSKSKSLIAPQGLLLVHCRYVIAFLCNQVHCSCVKSVCEVSFKET